MIALLLVLSGVLNEPDEVPQNPPAELEVRRLVRELDDPSLASREAAEEALVDLGPEVLELLPPVSRTMSAEVRVRLERVRERLQRAAAETTAQGSRIDLRGEMPLSEALAALEEQSGNPILDFRERFGQQVTDPPVETDFQETTFWEALDHVLDQAQLTVYHYGDQPDALAIVGRDAEEYGRSERAAYSGLYRFEGVSLLARRDLRNPRNDSLRLGLEVAWEPRTRPIVMQLPLDQIQAVDEAGDQIPILGSTGRLEIPLNGEQAVTELRLPFELPERESTRIADLEGRLEALLPGRTHQFTFEDLETARGVERRRAGVQVTLEQVRQDVGRYEARMRIRFDQAGVALESHRGWVFQNEAYLLDADGQRIDPVASQPTRQTPNELGMAYVFDHDNGLAGYRLVYETPVLIIPVRVDFRFQDIPLP